MSDVAQREDSCALRQASSGSAEGVNEKAITPTTSQPLLHELALLATEFVLLP